MGGGKGGLKDGTREERVEGERELGEGEEKKPGGTLLLNLYLRRPISSLNYPFPLRFTSL